MNRPTRFVIATLGATALTSMFVVQSFAQDTKKPAAPTAPAAATAAQDQGDFQLPPGMTQEEFEACMAAGQPGEMQAWLCEDAGTWNGTSKMWMSPDSEPAVSTCSMTATPILGGRFIETTFTGEIPGAGPFEGRGLVGYDNAAGKFQSTWCDTMGTGIMVGEGELSSDKKTLTINYSYFCPMAKKMCSMRESVTRTSKNEQVFRMWMTDIASGKEYMMMEATYTRASKAAQTANAAGR